MKLRIELPYDPAIILLGIYSKGYLPQLGIYRCSEKKGHLYPNVYSSNGHSHQTVERKKMPFNGRMDKEDVWSIYTMEYYASIRKDEYPTSVSTWTGLEEIMLSEISQAESIFIWFLTSGA